MFRSLSPHGVLNSWHKITVTYYGEITIEPILNPEFDVDHDFEVKNGCFQSLFPRFRVISAYSAGRASHSDHFSGQVFPWPLQDFIFFDEIFNSAHAGPPTWWGMRSKPPKVLKGDLRRPKLKIAKSVSIPCTKESWWYVFLIYWWINYGWKHSSKSIHNKFIILIHVNYIWI